MGASKSPITVMSFSKILQASGSDRCISKGRTTHGRIITSGFSSDVFTNNHLVSMYVKCDLISHARKVFDRMPTRNLTSWTTLVTGYAQMGLAEEALNCFKLMVHDGFLPNSYTFVGAISACSSICAARTGKEIHGMVYKVDGELNNYVSNALVKLYGKCAMLSYAQVVFDSISSPTAVSLNSLITSYCQSGEYMECLKIFSQSHNAGLEVNEFSFASILGACAALENLENGVQLHTLVVKFGLGSDEFVQTGLINFYAKCRSLVSAHKAFLEINMPQLAAWTALIGGYAQSENKREALVLFCDFHSSGLVPGERTLASVLGAFADEMEIAFGKQLHSLIIKLGFSSHIFVGNALLDFYAKCGLLVESSIIFSDMDRHDIVSWNALISGHARSGHPRRAAKLLHAMLLEGFEPNPWTYSSILGACSVLPSVEWGKQTHCHILKNRFDSGVVVGSALVDMYAKCGRLSDARIVFDNLQSRNLISWNSMLAGYAQHGFGDDALVLYNIMQREGVKPNDITFLGILTACGHMGLVEEGSRHFESMTRDYGILPRMDHLACMVSLYGRKGQTKRAYDLLTNSPLDPDKVVWRCLLSACKGHKDLELGRYAAENIIRIDPEDTSAHIALSNIYAEAKMWEEAANIRKVIKEKELKKDTGYSWTELNNAVYSFASGYSMHSEQKNLHDTLKGLTAQLVDEGYKPDFMVCR